MSTPIQQFFKEHGISEVEAVVPDMAGIARGNAHAIGNGIGDGQSLRLRGSLKFDAHRRDHADEEGIGESADFEEQFEPPGIPAFQARENEGKRHSEDGDNGKRDRRLGNFGAI